ncbi:MAG: protein arginine kinase [Clostridia bacterium]|nr:protein arginine kinase [Clostridia bacterium]
MKWYNKEGNLNEIILSTRVRLSRNLKDYPFPVRLDENGKKQVCALVKDIFLKEKEDLNFIEMESLSDYEAVSLTEKHLISPRFASDGEGGALILSEDESVSIMLCEEDHVKIQIIEPGLSLLAAFEKANEFDKELEASLPVAFDEKLGYLTQCPTNLGTGMRASVILHLPGLAASRSISRLSSTVSKLGLTLKSVYADEKEYIGDIYQLSNQVTMGISEDMAVQNLNAIAEQIAQQEKQAREILVKDDRVIDRIFRSYGILKSAHMLTCSEFTKLLSLVRLGAAQGLLNIPLETLSTLLIEMQPATVNAISKRALSRSERDIIRAERVREALK